MAVCAGNTPLYLVDIYNVSPAANNCRGVVDELGGGPIPYRLTDYYLNKSPKARVFGQLGSATNNAVPTSGNLALTKLRGTTSIGFPYTSLSSSTSVQSPVALSLRDYAYISFFISAVDSGGSGNKSNYGTLMGYGAEPYATYRSGTPFTNGEGSLYWTSGFGLGSNGTAYWVYCTFSGTPSATSSPINTWLPLTSNRRWGIETNYPTSRSCSMTVSVAAANGGPTLLSTSASYSIGVV